MRVWGLGSRHGSKVDFDFGTVERSASTSSSPAHRSAHGMHSAMKYHVPTSLSRPTCISSDELQASEPSKL